MDAGYWVNDKLYLSLIIPYVNIHNSERGGPRVNLNGLGDISLIAEWIAKSTSEKSQFSFLFGMEFPTGEDSSAPLIGNAAPSLLQVGSGTWDPLLGVKYRYRSKNWIFYSTLFSQTHLGESKGHAKPGNIISFSNTITKKISSKFSASLGLEWLYRRQDKLNGKKIVNTGGNSVYIRPGLRTQLSANTYLDFSAKIPIYFDVRSTQLVPGINYTISLGWSF